MVTIINAIQAEFQTAQIWETINAYNKEIDERIIDGAPQIAINRMRDTVRAMTRRAMDLQKEIDDYNRYE
jgi:hypothetical protein